MSLILSCASLAHMIKLAPVWGLNTLVFRGPESFDVFGLPCPGTPGKDSGESFANCVGELLGID